MITRRAFDLWKRRVLCNDCSIGLGAFKDDPDRPPLGNPLLHQEPHEFIAAEDGARED